MQRYERAKKGTRYYIVGCRCRWWRFREKFVAGNTCASDQPPDTCTLMMLNCNSLCLYNLQRSENSALPAHILRKETCSVRIWYTFAHMWPRIAKHICTRSDKQTSRPLISVNCGVEGAKKPNATLDFSITNRQHNSSSPHRRHAASTLNAPTPSACKRPLTF